MRPEYDFSGGVRGKHYVAYREGTNVVFLDPDVASVFGDSDSVNQILRSLVQFAKHAVPSKRKTGRSMVSSSRRHAKNRKSAAKSSRP
jgi:hypothetical protein